MGRIIDKKYFEAPTLEVAKNLLGKILVRRFQGKIIAGVIAETEAYVGPFDKASHASRGKTARTEVMFGEAGKIYVYLIYGMHHCLNIVTEKANYPAAVLIRKVRVGDLEISGPGRVAKFFKINRALNKKMLGRKSGLWIEPDRKNNKFKIKRGKRIGVDYAGAWADKPWRFYLIN